MKKTSQGFGVLRGTPPQRRAWFTWADVDGESDSWMHDVSDDSYYVEADTKDEAIVEAKQQVPHGANFSHVEYVGQRVLRG